jgi:MFS transporter, FSR family, fosmidomycin resistance protein
MRRIVDGLLPAGVDRRGIGVLSAGHFGADFFQGTVPALMPFLVADRGYSYAQVGALVLAASLGSAFLQPLLGAAADRVNGTWMMPVGLFLAVAGLVGTALLGSYPATAAALMVGGVGVAAYHPEAIRFASTVSRGREGSGMSVFAVGGSAGFMIGPAVTSAAILVLGLHGLLAVAVVELAIALLVLSQLPYLGRFRDAPGKTAGRSGASDWGRFSVASATAIARATCAIGVQAFVPLYLVHELGLGKGEATLVISAYFATSLVGSIAGGQLADRYGFLRVVAVSTGLGAPLLLPLPFVGTAGIFALVAAYGLVNGMNFYPLVVVAQRAVPAHMGLAAGVTLGMSIGLGSAFVALLGGLADTSGLTAVLWALTATALVAGILGAYLATTGRRSRLPAAAVSP